MGNGQSVPQPRRRTAWKGAGLWLCAQQSRTMYPLTHGAVVLRKRTVLTENSAHAQLRSVNEYVWLVQLAWEKHHRARTRCGREGSRRTFETGSALSQ